jgi:hypothetical protein
MRHLRHLLFGMLVPLLEVVLVLAGLCILGWEGLAYMHTGAWTTISLGTFWEPAGPTPLTRWALSLPLSGVCMGTGVAMFFVMPPAYSFA